MTVLEIIERTLNSREAFCKFLTANDTGETGGHQSGIYIPKEVAPKFFEISGNKGSNNEKVIRIKWQDDFYTESKIKYYGKGTRNEFRITRFGRGFPFLNSDYTGALFVLLKINEEEYEGYILNSEDEINSYLESLNMTPVDTNNYIKIDRSIDFGKEKEIQKFIDSLVEEFPKTDILSKAARDIYSKVNKTHLIPDLRLIEWSRTEYDIFRALEKERYGFKIRNGFSNMEEFISTANTILNRRKSRAGKSLEHHLSAIFDEEQLKYTSQAHTEGNKRPDFIFPSEEDYHNLNFPKKSLVSLAAKTTCKDRWRQILNEANRLRDENKYLCTLQQGISLKQLSEMEDEKVILVVPKPYIKTYPPAYQEKIWTITKFIEYVKELERINVR